MLLHESITTWNSNVLVVLLSSDGSGDTQESAPDSSNTRRDVLRKVRVLVVDDEKSIAQSLRDILARAGYDSVFALSGGQAIELAQQLCPDVVISDVIMPDLDGVQTALRIRDACPDAHILLFSGQAATSNILERARAEGNDFDVLPKPIHPARLLAALRKLM